MLRTTLLSLLVLMTGLLKAQDKLEVCATIPPLKWLSQQVGGDQVKAESLLSEMTDPHSFSLSPGQLQLIKKADVVLSCHSMEFEKKVFKLRKDTVYPKTFNYENEHVWLSTVFLRLNAKGLSEKLISLRPGKKAYFTKLLETFNQKLDALEKGMAASLKQVKQRKFYSYHGVFYYMAKQFNLEETNIEVEKRTPSPRELLTIMNAAKRDKIRTIFMQAQFNDRPAKMIAQRSGAKVIKMNPLQEDCLQTLRDAAKALAK